MKLEEAKTAKWFILEGFEMGGPFMYIISILGLIMLVITVWKVIGLIKKTNVNLKWLDLIRMAGSVALAVGFLSQILGIVGALEAIRRAGDIAPALVMEGAMVSFMPPIYGLIVFIFSMLFYYILKEVIKARNN